MSVLSSCPVDSKSNDEGNGHENGKIAPPHVQHTFLYISLSSLHDCDGKFPHGTSYGGRWDTTYTTNFSFSILTWVRSPRIHTVPGKLTCIV